MRFRVGASKVSANARGFGSWMYSVSRVLVTTRTSAAAASAASRPLSSA